MVATKSSALQMPILLESKVILCQIDEVRRFYLCNFLFVGDERYRRTQTKKKETYIKFNTQFMCAKTIMRREDIKLNNGENVRVWSIELILFTGIFIDLNEIIHHT